MRHHFYLLGAAALVCAAYLGWVFGSRRTMTARGFRPPAHATAPAPDGYTGPKIVQFYAPTPSLTEGENTVICYGVENTVAVRLEPPIEAISPSFNRCISAQPRKTSRYTLIAEGKDGTTVSASFDLAVQPDPATAPRIVKIWTAWTKPDRFGLTAHNICFRTEHTTEVSVDPPMFPPYGGVTGCFYVVPEQTTTYRLTGRDDKGRVVTQTYRVEVNGGPTGKPRYLKTTERFTPATM